MRKGFLISIHTNKNKNHSSASIRSRGLAGFVRELSFFLVANWSLGLDLARARAGKCRQTEARAKPDLHNLSFGTQPETKETICNGTVFYDPRLQPARGTHSPLPNGAATAVAKYYKRTA